MSAYDPKLKLIIMERIMRLFFALFILFLCSRVIAEEKLIENEIKVTEDTAILFAQCYGTFSAVSDFFYESNPSMAKFYKETGQGAKMSSSYYFIMFYTLKGTEVKGVTYGKYFDYIDSIANGKINQIAAYFENESLAEIQRELQLCADINDLQKLTMREIRKDLNDIE